MAETRKKSTTKAPKAAKELAESIQGLEAELLEGLPTPEVLAKYEKIVPGGAARLLDLAEQREQQERELEQKAFQTEIYLEKFKQASHFVLALVAGVFGGMLLLQGNELVGLIIILADAAVMVGAAKLSVER